MTNNVETELSFRYPMQVMKKRYLQGSCYAICPKCENTMERDYMAFCDRCGQKLNWKNYKKAEVIK